MLQKHLWRGSLLPLGCAAVVNRAPRFTCAIAANGFGAAAPPSGSKLPRHTSPIAPQHSAFS
ncbi:hypothetical protein C1X64_00495 [Pseudomonas sp. GW456-E7]|nr:hypothetical protein C1X64_00495 [Pseudomonas sp. GW456-E7]